MPDRPSGPLNSPALLVQRLKLLMLARATGRATETCHEEYEQLRKQLVESPIVTLLPEVVLTYRTLDEFWMFIQPAFRTYNERQRYLIDKFDPLLRHLEWGAPPPQVADRLDARKSNATDEKDRASMSKIRTDLKAVFVVHGRNAVAREELFTFLRALHLRPLEWGQVVKQTGKSSPYVGEVLDAGLLAAQAVVVLLTPDDEARLRIPYQSANDSPQEAQLTGQPRQNVIFEAGMAMGKCPDRTIIVEMGKLRQMTDIVGRHAVRLNGSPESRNELANRLETAGCDVDRSGGDWFRAGNFDKVLSELNEIERTAFHAATRSTVFQHCLSTEAEEYLVEISRPRNETAFGVRFMRSLTGKDVKYLEMMEQFVDLGLVREGIDFFSLTSAGRIETDRLWRKRILRTLSKSRNQPWSLEDLSEKVTLNDGEAETAELRKHLGDLEEKGLVSVEEISLDGMLDIRITPKGREAIVEEATEVQLKSGYSHNL